MNLQGITAGYVAAVNPPIAGQWRQSTGFTVDDTKGGEQVPTYATPVNVSLQVQALSGRELAHLDGMNIQGVMRAVYMQGAIEGVDRAAVKGGDLLNFNGRVWKIAQVMEPWDTGGWTKLAVVQQDDL